MRDVVSTVVSAGLVLALAGCASHAQPATTARPAALEGFKPEAAAALGEGDLWLLGTVPCMTGRCAAVARSGNGGRSFTRSAAPELRSRTITPELVFANRGDGYALAPWPGSGLFATHDGGSSWHRLRLGDVLAFATGSGNADAVTARCTPDRCGGYRLERSAAASDSWSASPLPFTPDGSIVDLAARNGDVWLLATEAGGLAAHDRLARSRDGGRTFVTGPGPCYAGLGGSLAPTAGKVVWAVCPTGMLAGAFRSTDGDSFTSLHTPPLANSARLAPASATTAVLFANAAGARLLRTTDAGASWSPVRTPPHPALGVSWLELATPRVGYALVQADETGRQALWRTRDAGASWTRIRLG